MIALHLLQIEHTRLNFKYMGNIAIIYSVPKNIDKEFVVKKLYRTLVSNSFSNTAKNESHILYSFY